MKRLFDIFVSVSALILLLSVFAIICIAVKITSYGLVIFKQERAGKRGKPFTFYKFRTMRTDVDPFGPCRLVS